MLLITFTMLEHFTGNDTNPLMGLSLLTSLQKQNFFTFHGSKFIGKQIGSRIIFFKDSVHAPRRRKVTEKQIAALRVTKFNGLLSNKSQKRIIGICQNWDDTLSAMNSRNKLQGLPHKRQIIMLTLTLSREQTNDDRVIKRRILIPFLSQLVRENSDINYLWKAEAQENGNIHFHVFIDRYIPKDEIRLLWNRLQKVADYHPESLSAENDYGSPSTRIEGLRDKNNAVSYAAKYISKNEGKRPIEGRLWGCNNKLRELKPLECILSEKEVLEVVYNLVHNSQNIVLGDHFMILNQIAPRNLINLVPLTNYRFNKALVWNVDKLTQTVFNVQDVLKKTEWYSEVMHEFGTIAGSYLDNNSMLFSDKDFIKESNIN